MKPLSDVISCAVNSAGTDISRCVRTGLQVCYHKDSSGVARSGWLQGCSPPYKAPVHLLCYDCATQNPWRASGSTNPPGGSKAPRVVLASVSWLQGPGNLMCGCVPDLILHPLLPSSLRSQAHWFFGSSRNLKLLPASAPWHHMPGSHFLLWFHIRDLSSPLDSILSQELPFLSLLPFLHCTDISQHIMYLVLFLSVWYFSSTCQNEGSQGPKPQKQNKSKLECVSIPQQLSCTVESWRQ